MHSCPPYFKSSVGKKQIVAFTGLFLILFVIGHLAGNLFIFMGPEAFNHYAEKLAKLRPGLYLVEAGLAYIFFIHILFTFLLVHDNFRARPVKYFVYKSSEKRSLATRLMPVTGSILFAFIVWHLLDFTFINHDGPRKMIHNKDFGVYGVVFNSFSDPFHGLLYIIAMIALGLHLSHAIQSVAQTFGCNKIWIGRLQRASNFIGGLIAAAFSSIPIFILYLSKTGASYFLM